MNFTLSHSISCARGAGVIRLSSDRDGKKPKILVLHGLGSMKERQLTVMYRLAVAGFDVLAIDLFLHGDRPEAIYRQQLLDTDFVTAVRDVIYETANDIPAICQEFNLDISQAGVLGISAGGFVAHVLAIQQPQCKAMVAAISSPDWLNIDPSRSPEPDSPEGILLGAMSPVNHARSYAPLPLCLLNGAEDTVVSPLGSQYLYNRLGPIYDEAGVGNHLNLELFPDQGHIYTDEMQDRTVEWFEEHLQ